jgi:two-component system copper resistance phosphate regulon response regulator CusR
MRILVVEDEKRIAAAIRKGLTIRGFEVSVAHNGEEGFYMMSVDTFDLLILDIMLPSRNGLEILATLRKLGNKIPVMLLTARDSVEDIVHGLDTGADAYMVKPFALSELHARIRTLTKRGATESNTVLVVGDLRINVTDHTATRAGVRLALSSQESAVLEYLLKNKGNVVSREMLAREVWNADPKQVPLQNIIDVTMSRLRRKIDEPFSGNLLQTIRGVGYRIREEIA